MVFLFAEGIAVGGDDPGSVMKAGGDLYVEDDTRLPAALKKGD